MANRNFSLTIPEELIEQTERLVRIRNSKPNSGKWSKNYIMRLALEEYLNRNEAEFEKGGQEIASEE
jgi:hypothetical protein